MKRICLVLFISTINSIHLIELNEKSKSISFKRNPISDKTDTERILETSSSYIFPSINYLQNPARILEVFRIQKRNENVLRSQNNVLKQTDVVLDSVPSNVELSNSVRTFIIPKKKRDRLDLKTDSLPNDSMDTTYISNI